MNGSPIIQMRLQEPPGSVPAHAGRRSLLHLSLMLPLFIAPAASAQPGVERIGDFYVRQSVDKISRANETAVVLEDEGRRGATSWWICAGAIVVTEVEVSAPDFVRPEQEWLATKRFDDAAPDTFVLRYSLVAPSWRQIAEADRAGFISSVRSSRRMTLRVFDLRLREHEFVFDLSGARDALDRLACIRGLRTRAAGASVRNAPPARPRGGGTGPSQRRTGTAAQTEYDRALSAGLVPLSDTAAARLPVALYSSWARLYARLAQQPEKTGSESWDQYARRIRAANPDLYALPIVCGARFTYDEATRQMSFRFRNASRSSSISAVVVCLNGENDGSSYIGRNGYGRQSRVNVTEREEYAIAADRPWSGNLRSERRWTMAPADAARLPYLQAVLVVRPAAGRSDPVVTLEEQVTKATAADPREERYKTYTVRADYIALWVVDSVSRAVIYREVLEGRFR